MKKLALVPLALMALPSLAAAHSRLVAQDEEGGDATAEVALIEETVRVTIDEQYAQARLRQVFHNRSNRRLEGRYSLVLGDGVRVDGFAYWTGGQKIVGEVFEKETAARVYEEVTGLGRDPGLLEQVGEGAFSFRLFPIEPDERKPVEVYWGGWLRRSGNVLEYRLPLAHARSSVELHLRDARGIREVSSATHVLELQNDSTTHVVVRARGLGKGSGNAGTADQAPNSDNGAELVLRYVVGGADWQVSAFVHRDEDQDGYLVTSLAAPALVGKAEVAAKDITLVLDHSGSMSGEPLEQAKAAAKAVVARLRDDDRVNVIAFDDNVDTLYAVPRAMSETTRKEALAYIDRLHDAGGTNLALALERALAAQEANGRPHVILFLTDGQSDAQATIKAARADTGDARVFTIGVGSGVDKPLLSRLAGEKRGRFTYIASIPAIEHKVAELYSQIDAPVLVGVSIEAKGAQLAGTYPRTTPDLFRNDELVLSSRIRGDGPVTLTIRGQLQGKAVAFTKVVQVPRTETRPWVGRMWAAARVDDLLEEIAVYGETDELKTEAINLAVAYNLASPYTSFLAIPESELTDGARELLATARERKQRILAAHKDAVALSRSSMPPGDPILSVRAPSDARQVTAYFPFGLVKDLGYDADTEKWQVRFLVPKDVVDGEYAVKIVIVHADGTVEVAEIPYTIDSGAPDFEVTVEETAAGALIKVATAEESRLVTVASTTDLSMRVELSRRADGLYFEGTLPLSAGTHELRVVVADAARNEADSLINVVIQPELEPEIKPGIED